MKNTAVWRLFTRHFYGSFSGSLTASGVIGPLLVALLCVFTGILGYTTYATFSTETAFGIAFGSAAVVAMSQTLILSARPKVFEPLFGGLDRMYRVHKWLGISALVLMVLHVQFEPHFRHFRHRTALGEFASEVGEFVYIALLALIALSLFRKLPFTRLEIPYPIWRFLHRFMGVFFALVLFHQFFVDMPHRVNPSLSILLNSFGVAGLTAWILTEFVSPKRRRLAFTVHEITRHGETTALTLMPKGRAMRWRPGQFAFISAPEAGLSEPHPFTIASAQRADGTLSLSIKALGSWTSLLPDALRQGMNVQVEGPYGRFDFRRGGLQQIWLAGGVGITPFLAWAESLTDTERRDIKLLYCVRRLQDAVGLETFQAAAARNARFTFEVVTTASEGRVTAERLIAAVPFPVSEADFWFCGPTGLKHGILSGLRELGQIPRRVHFEYFEFV